MREEEDRLCGLVTVDLLDGRAGGDGLDFRGERGPLGVVLCQNRQVVWCRRQSSPGARRPRQRLLRSFFAAKAANSSSFCCSAAFVVLAGINVPRSEGSTAVLAVAVGHAMRVLERCLADVIWSSGRSQTEAVFASVLQAASSHASEVPEATPCDDSECAWTSRVDFAATTLAIAELQSFVASGKLEAQHGVWTQTNWFLRTSERLAALRRDRLCKRGRQRAAEALKRAAHCRPSVGAAAGHPLRRQGLQTPATPPLRPPVAPDRPAGARTPPAGPARERERELRDETLRPHRSRIPAHGGEQDARDQGLEIDPELLRRRVGRSADARRACSSSSRARSRSTRRRGTRAAGFPLGETRRSPST